MSVVIETNMGDITVDLYVAERPKACLNFLKLCKMKAFHFNLFHFVQRNFIIQTGDPSGTGRGGESIFKHIYGDQVLRRTRGQCGAGSGAAANKESMRRPLVTPYSIACVGVLVATERLSHHVCWSVGRSVDPLVF